MKYGDYQRNHVIFPGREKALDEFLHSTAVINGKPTKHKLEHSFSSNSEDALTWSCFDVLRNLPHNIMIHALDEILEDAFDGNKPFSFSNAKNVCVDIGKRYETTNLPKKESTEVDASIETEGKLIFFEAKLYGSISLPNDNHEYNQIAKKLRVGLDCAHRGSKEFYFIFLDIAPLEKMYQRRPKTEAEEPSSQFEDKWKSAWWFDYYKNGRNGSLKPLVDVLKGIETSQSEVEEVATKMGWFTWASLFKTTLRAVVQK